MNGIKPNAFIEFTINYLNMSPKAFNLCGTTRNQSVWSFFQPSIRKSQNFIMQTFAYYLIFNGLHHEF
jgi:hypothetical protein